MDDAQDAGKPGWGASLQRLLDLSGVLAVVLSTDEGLPLAGRAGAGLDEEALAAAAGELGRLGQEAVKGSGSKLEMVVLDASRFRFIVRPVSLGHLMLVTEPRADTEPLLAEIKSAAVELAAAEAQVG